MPVYEYRCRLCGERFEKLVRTASNPPVIVCPRCGSEEVQKEISLFGLGGGARSSASSCAPSGGSL